MIQTLYVYIRSGIVTMKSLLCLQQNLQFTPETDQLIITKELNTHLTSYLHIIFEYEHTQIITYIMTSLPHNKIPSTPMISS